MKIRQVLTPQQRRLITSVAIASTLAIWFLLTIPFLPAEPQAAPVGAPHAYTAQLDQSRQLTPALGPGGQGAIPQPPPPPPEPPPVPTARPLVPAYILPSPGAVLLALVHLHTEE